MPTSEPMTNGEIARSLTRIEKTLEGLSTKMDDRPTWQDVRRMEDGLNARITDLENWQTWAQRIVLTAVILAIIGLVIGVPASSA